MSLSQWKVRTSATHAVHEARSPAEFLSLFKAHCSRDVEQLLSALVDLPHVAALVLGGSIALGIGTGASDIDLLVVIDNEQAMTGQLTEHDVVFAFDDLSSGTQSRLAKYGLLLDGLKVDFMFIDAARLDALIARATGPRPNLAPREIALLSRLKSGWDLRPVAPSFEETLRRFRGERALEVQCVVRHLRNALNDLEHAKQAIGDGVELPVYLARRVVDQCFQACIAASGIAFVGAKWIRYINRRPSALSRDPAVAEQIKAKGLKLLIAETPSSADLQSFLAAIAQFFKWVRAEIERDLEMKIAISLCRQIYDPDVDTA